jgi:hypothetical protein
MRWPLNNYTITQGFGANASYYKQFGQNGHNGIDMGAPAGTPVYAAEAGTIAFEGWGQNHSWMGSIAGISIIIRHAALHTGYAHLASTVVNNNQTVSKGQLIGYVGATGTATGPHLHFEVFPASPNFSNGYAGRIDPTPHVSSVKTATADEIKRAYREILERDADPAGITHYMKYPFDFVRKDLAASQEKRQLDARKAEAARVAAAQAASAAAKAAEDAKKAAQAKAAAEAAEKAEQQRLAAEAELARVAEEERIAREAAEARAKAQQEFETKAKEDAMATTAEQTKQIQAIADTVAESDVVKSLISKVSDRTKFIVYCVGDSLLGLGLIVPQIIALIHATDPVTQGALLAGILSTAGGFLLVMFGIYKSSTKQ